MNNIDKDNLNKLVPRIYKIIKNLPENMDLNILNNIFDENEKLKKQNNKLQDKIKELQNRKDTNEKTFLNIYHNLKKKIDKLQNEIYDLETREHMLISEYENNEKSKSDLQEIIKRKDNEITDLKNINDELNNKLIFKKKEETLNTTLLINKIKNELDTLRTNYNEQIKYNNGLKKLIANYKEDLKISEDKNKKNIDLLIIIETEKKQLEEQFITLNQKINLLNEENKKSNSNDTLIHKLENDIMTKNKEIETLKNNMTDTNMITKLNDVIEKQNNEIKLLEDKYKKLYEENEKNKIENIELQIKINQLIKSDDETDYSSNYDTEYTSEESESEIETEIKKNTQKIFGIKHRKLRQPTQDFFDNLLKEQENQSNKKEVAIKEPENFIYSTEHNVEYLQNSNKLFPKEQRKYYKDKYMKDEPTTNINNEIELIINNKKDDNIIIDNDKKVVINPIIQNTIPTKLIGGVNKKDRFTIHDIEGTLKMYINNDFSTITDQNIDKNDINLGRRIYNRKNVRRCRSKNN